MDFNSYMLMKGGGGDDGGGGGGHSGGGGGGSSGYDHMPGDAAKGIFAAQLAHTGQAFQQACPSFAWAGSLFAAAGALLSNAKPAGIDSLGTISVFGHTANVPGALFSAGKGGRG